MACSIRRPYKPAVLRGLNQRSSTRRPTAATPRRIWKLRGQILRRFALLGSGCCFCALGACCFSRGPSATVRRGRGGRAAGEPTDGLAFSRGQEPARKARPRLTDLPGRTPGKRRRGVSFLFGDFLFGQAKRKSLGPRQRLETALSLAITQKQEPQPSPGGRRIHQSAPSRIRVARLRRSRREPAVLGACETGTSNIPDTSVRTLGSSASGTLTTKTLDDSLRSSLRGRRTGVLRTTRLSCLTSLRLLRSASQE